MSLPGSRWLVGFTLFALLLGAFWLCGTFAGDNRGVPGSSPGAALFFAVILAYILPIYAYISERTASALSQLAPHLDAADAQVTEWTRRIYHKPVGWLVTVLGIGMAGGIAHNLLLLESPGALLDRATASPAVAATVVGTQVVWLVVTLVVAALMDNAQLLAAAARRCRVDLLHVGRLRPFATVAVISTLALIGAQAAFPIMFVDETLSAAAYLPGLVATGLPMIMIAGLPVWPVHRRIAEAKHRALGQVEARIAELPEANPATPETLQALAPLLTYRRELLDVPEWPFDLGVVTRFALYLIIPPLTWVGAALIENLVDTLL